MKNISKCSILLSIVLMISLSNTAVANSLPNCHEDKCTSADPCPNGYGDCDNNANCINGTCAIDVGSQYGCPKWIDVCVYSELPGSSSSSSSSIASSSSTILSSSSSSSSSSSTSRTTVLTTTTLLPNCHDDKCTSENPCSPGYGDCDNNANCINGTCAIDVGSQYGCPMWVDICVYNLGVVSSSIASSSSSSSSTSSTSSSSSSSLPGVYGCRVLSVPNMEYKQKANIIPSIPSGDGCITVNASNITLDCQNYLMSNSSFDTIGIYSNKVQTTIRNCNVSVGQDGGFGIALEGANNSGIYNNTLNYQLVGLYLDSTYGAVVDSSTFLNDSFGVILLSSSYNNLSNVSVYMNGSLFDLNLTYYSHAANSPFSSSEELENSIKNLVSYNNPSHTASLDGDNPHSVESTPKDRISTLSSVGDFDALLDDMPYPTQVEAVGPSYSLIGILIVNNSSYNTLSKINVNNSVFGVVIGRNSHYNTLSNVRVNIGLFGISIGNSSYSKLSTVTTFGNILGILLIRNSSYTNLSGIISSIGLLGILQASSSYNTYSNVVVSRNILGVGLYSSHYNNLSNIRVYNNSLLGLGLYNSSRNLIRNSNLSENWYYDFLIGTLTDSNEGCMNTLDNVTSSGGGLMGYYNSSVTLSDRVFSELFLCGADYSVLNNITISGSNRIGNDGLILFHTNWSNITNINSSENYYGLFMLFSHNNLISNITANNNSDDGVYMDTVEYNTLSDVTANYNDWDGLYMDEGVNNNISNITANYNWDDGLDIEDSDNNTLSDIKASYNDDDGLSMDYSYNNILLNAQTNNNSNDGIALYDSLSNSFSGLTMGNNSDYGIQLYDSLNNTFSTVTGNENNGGVFLSDSRDNTFKETGLVNNASRNLYITSSSTNVVFLNSTYNISWEYVTSSSQLIRKWYFDAYVNDSSGNALSQVNVSGWNVFGSFAFNASTSSGFIPQVTLVEYINNGTRTYYGNYTINASKSGYTPSTRSVNLTTNLFEIFTLTPIVPG